MALAAHQNPNIPFRIVGFTCVQGNTGVDNVTINVTRTLQTAGVSNVNRIPSFQCNFHSGGILNSWFFLHAALLQIPIFRGADSALVFPLDLGDDPYHGEDGFGDAGLPPVQPSIEPEHGVNAIIQLAELYKSKNIRSTSEWAGGELELDWTFLLTFDTQVTWPFLLLVP